jgi:hypothetical protein
MLMNVQLRPAAGAPPMGQPPGAGSADLVSKAAGGRVVSFWAGAHGYRGWWLVFGLVLAFSALASPASADGATPTAQGYVLIQQALGHLASDTGPMGVAAASAAVDDALAAPDLQGVDVARVKQARSALQGDQVVAAQALLQHSIAGALSRLDPASGEQTGTTLVLTPLPGRGGLTGQDWGFGVVSLLLALAGIALALRYRPADNLAQLRRRLADGPTVALSPASVASAASGPVMVDHDHDQTDGSRP